MINEKKIIRSSESFALLKSQIIYVESEYNEYLNDFFIQNQRSILSILQQSGKNVEFVFVPRIFLTATKSGALFEELIHYYFPYSRNSALGSPLLDYFTTPFFTKILFSKSDYKGEVKPGLIRFVEQKEEDWESYSVFEYYPFDLSDKTPLAVQIQQFISRIDLDNDAQGVEIDLNVIEKIKKDILNLKQLGFYELVLKEIGKVLGEETGKSAIVHNREKDKLSRLVIDSEYRLLLPDYDEEIKMPPLPKALFILFLLHPEGIILKQLSEYEAELLAIYKILSNRETYKAMVESIHDMCSPALSGSVHEKLSRIREAFVKRIAEEYARFYYVSGERGEEKHIRIDRNLITLPEEFHHIQ